MPNKKQEIIERFDKIDNCTNYFEEHSAIRSFISYIIDDIYDDIERSLPGEEPEYDDYPDSEGFNMCLSQVKQIINSKRI